MPTTWKCLKSGKGPKGVISPCGLITFTIVETRAPIASASLAPSKMPGYSPSLLCRSSNEPSTSVVRICDTRNSASGSTPLMTQPLALTGVAIIISPYRVGATASTCST